MSLNCVELDSLAKRIDISRYSSWTKLKFVTARILKLYKKYKKSETNVVLATILPADLQRAEHFWITEAQKQLITSLQKHTLAKLNPRYDRRGILVVEGALSDGCK